MVGVVVVVGVVVLAGEVFAENVAGLVVAADVVVVFVII